MHKARGQKKKQFSVGLRRRDPSLQPSGRLPGVMIYPSSCGTGTWPKHVCCSLCSYFSSHFLPCSHHPLPRRGSATQGRPAEGLQAAGRWQGPLAGHRAPGPFPSGPCHHRPLPFAVTPASSHACFPKIPLQLLEVSPGMSSPIFN